MLPRPGKDIKKMGYDIYIWRKFIIKLLLKTKLINNLKYYILNTKLKINNKRPNYKNKRLNYLIFPIKHLKY